MFQTFLQVKGQGLIRSNLLSYGKLFHSYLSYVVHRLMQNINCQQLCKCLHIFFTVFSTATSYLPLLSTQLSRQLSYYEMTNYFYIKVGTQSFHCIAPLWHSLIRNKIIFSNIYLFPSLILLLITGWASSPSINILNHRVLDPV